MPLDHARSANVCKFRRGTRVRYAVRVYMFLPHSHRMSHPFRQLGQQKQHLPAYPASTHNSKIRRSSQVPFGKHLKPMNNRLLFVFAKTACPNHAHDYLIWADRCGLRSTLSYPSNILSLPPFLLAPSLQPSPVYVAGVMKLLPPHPCSAGT